MVADYVRFTIDMAPTLLNMKVEEGVNQIAFEFQYCDELIVDTQGATICAHAPTVGEQGTLFIRVVYEQNWLPGFDEVRPSYETCHPQPTPTPALR